MSLLEIRDLAVTFATGSGAFKAVDGVDLSINPGEVLAIVGESASGNSVAMLALMGLFIPVAALIPVQGLVQFGSNAGRTFVQRLVDAFGEPIESPYPALNRLFPSAERIAQLNERPPIVGN